MSKALSLKKTRVDFISDLLQSKKLGTGDKERVFGLVAKEIDLMESKGDFILSEIEAIKAQLNAAVPEVPVIEEVVVKKKPPLKKYIDPLSNANFLMEINQDPILKTMTHNMDTNQLISVNEELNIPTYDFEKHIAEISFRLNLLGSKYKDKLSLGLWAKIYYYFSGEKPWSGDNIKMSWRHADLIAWAKQRKGQTPNPADDLGTDGFRFTRFETKSGELLQTLSELVLFFKRQVHVRFDNSLAYLIDGWNIDFRNNVIFDTTALENKIEFFTDVEKLHQAYKYLVQLCVKCNPKGKPRINLSLRKEEFNGARKIIFSIWHTNAICGRDKMDMLNRYGDTFTGIINNQINGLCDWTMDADFGKGDYANISVWPNNHLYYPIEKMQGVRYNLIFS